MGDKTFLFTYFINAKKTGLLEGSFFWAVPVEELGSHLLYLTSVVSLWQGNVKKSKKSTKIVNIEEENLRLFWTTWAILMKFSRKMIILNYHDNIKSHKKP